MHHQTVSVLVSVALLVPIRQGIERCVFIVVLAYRHNQDLFKFGEFYRRVPTARNHCCIIDNRVTVDGKPPALGYTFNFGAACFRGNLFCRQSTARAIL